MNAKETVKAQIEHRETEFVPYAHLVFEGDVAERVDEYYGSDRWRSRINNHIIEVTGGDIGIDFEGGTIVTDPFGTVWRLDLRPFHLEEPGLKEPTFEGYRFPTKEEFLHEGWRKKALGECEQWSDHFLVAGFGFGIFERTWAMRGFENALVDAVAEPDFYEELLECIEELQTSIIDELVTLPIDGVMFSDDWGDQRGVLLGPERWRKMIKPRLARMYERTHAAGKYVLSHCCGSVVEIMPDLTEIGLDAIESVQPEAMDPYRLKKEFGEKMTFWGGLGSQSVIPFGKPSEIRAEVDRLCREMSRGGGYILGPAKSLQPETPTENAVAVIESFLEHAGESLS